MSDTAGGDGNAFNITILFLIFSQKGFIAYIINIRKAAFLRGGFSIMKAVKFLWFLTAEIVMREVQIN
jgi:hypothetical protein